MSDQKPDVASRRKFLQGSAMAGTAAVAMPLMGMSTNAQAESLSDYFANYTGRGKGWHQRRGLGKVQRRLNQIF